MFKGNFPPPMKFLFHTLLICLSNKTTSFNEIPLKIQSLGYAILTNTDFNYSQALVADLVANLKNIKKGKTAAFLMFPRLLSYYLQKHVSQKAFEKGEAIKMNSLTSETFTRLMAKESDVFKTEAGGMGKF